MPREETLQYLGRLLLGENSVLTLGNYLIGPNCVRAGYRALAPYARTLATYEGFDAHANAVSTLRERKTTGEA